MTEDSIESLVEEVMSEANVKDVMERIQDWREAFLYSLHTLKQGPGKYVHVFLKESPDCPLATVVAIFRTVSEAFSKGIFQDGYSGDAILPIGLIEVPNFKRTTIIKVLKKQKCPDINCVGLIDLTHEDEKLRLGRIDLKNGIMTTAVIDRKMI